VAGGLAQCWMSGGDAVLHPRNRIVWQLPRLTRSGQLCLRRVQAELKTLLHAKRHGTAADLMALRNRLAVLAGQRVCSVAGIIGIREGRDGRNRIIGPRHSSAPVSKGTDIRGGSKFRTLQLIS